MTHQLVKKTLVALLVTGTFSVGALAQAPSQRVPDPIDQIFKNKNDIAANKATLEKKADSVDVELNRKAISGIAKQQFDDGKTIRANKDNIDKNTKAIAENKAALGNVNKNINGILRDVQDLTVRTTGNEAKSRSNEQKIKKNEENINKNASDIKENKNKIAENKKTIENKADKADVEKNRADIAANSRAIATFRSSSQNIAALTTKVDRNTARIDQLDSRVNELDKEVKNGLASQAALSGLFQPYNVGSLNLSTAVGGYKSKTALAVGSGYRFNENVAAKAGVAVSTNGGSATYNVGLNFEW